MAAGTTTAPPRGLSAEQVKRLLAVIPETPAGLRDRAIFLTLILTGRRRSEVLRLCVGDLVVDGGRVYYTYRGKGGKRGRRGGGAEGRGAPAGCHGG